MKNRISPFCCTLILVFFLVFIRNWSDLVANEPWAEDATDFLVGSLWLNVSIFKPVAACFMVAERAIALLAVKLSVEYAPLIISLINAVIFAFVSSAFSLNSFAWLVPNVFWRVLICVWISVSIGSYEIIGGLSCLAYIIAWGLALTLLVDPNITLSSFKKIALSLVWVVGLFSSPVASSLLPLALARCRISKGAYILPVIFSICFLILQLILSLMTSYQVSSPAVRPPFEFLLRWFESVVATMIYGPIFGHPRLTFFSILGPHFYRFFGLFGLMLILAGLYLKLDGKARLVSIALFASMIFFFFIHTFGRGYYSLGINTDEVVYPAIRHFWLPYASMLILFALFFQSIKSFWRYIGFYIILLFGLTTLIATRDWNKNFPKNQWSSAIRKLNSGENTATFVVAPISDKGEPWAEIIVIRSASKYQVIINGGNS